MNMDTTSKAVTAAVRGIRAAGLDPASDEGQRHLNAVIGPVLRHASAPPVDDRANDPQADDDPAPDDQLSARLAAIDAMSAQDVADNWDQVAATLKEARLAGRS